MAIRTASTGATGATGDPGEGLIAGGTAGQALVKASLSDFDVEWADIPEGPQGEQGIQGEPGADGEDGFSDFDPGSPGTIGGDSPGPATFTNLFATLFKASGRLGLVPDTDITAGAGGTRANAYALQDIALHHIAVCASSGDGVKVKDISFFGQIQFVHNGGAADSQVFGDTNTINGSPAATGVTLPVGKLAILISFTTSDWSFFILN